MSKEVNEERTPRTVADVKEMLTKHSNGEIQRTIQNCITILQNDHVLADAIRLNLLSERIDIVKPVGWPRSGKTLNDTDMKYILRRMEKSKIREAVEIAKERCAIAHFSKRLIKNLSGGYQQRVGIAQAIVHNPPFVVLDEPTNGLDPNQIVEIRNLIKEIAEDHSVLLSTHILSEVQATCNDIRMIEHGKVVFSGSMKDFDNYVVPSSFTVTFALPPSIEELAKIEHVLNIEELYPGTFRIRFDDDENITERVVALSIQNGWRLKEITMERCSLDIIFAQLSGKLKNNI